MNYIRILSSIWIMIYIFIICSLFFSKRKKNILINIVILLFFATLHFLNITYTTNLIVLVIDFIIKVLFIYTIFAENMSTVVSLFTNIYMIRVLFEILFRITFMILNISKPENYIIIFFASFLTIIFEMTFKRSLEEIIQDLSYQEKNAIIKIILINIFLILVVYIRIPNFYINFFPEHFTDLFLFLIISNLAIAIFNLNEKYNILNKNYQKVVEYVDFTEELLNEYKCFLHEYKNKLIIIKSLISIKNKKLQKYIDSILEEKAVNHYRWLMEIKSIPIAGVKGLINYKLIKMKELGIEVEVYISNDISDMKEEYLTNKEKDDLYSILGVFLDNAIEASLESNNKMASLHIYKEDDYIDIMIANTFKSINISRIEEKGFSSKGKNRGMGLFLVNEILKRNTKFEKETNIINDFFVQKLKISLKKNRISPQNDKISTD